MTTNTEALVIYADDTETEQSVIDAVSQVVEPANSPFGPINKKFRLWVTVEEVHE